MQGTEKLRARKAKTDWHVNELSWVNSMFRFATSLLCGLSQLFEFWCFPRSINSPYDLPMYVQVNSKINKQKKTERSNAPQLEVPAVELRFILLHQNVFFRFVFHRNVGTHRENFLQQSDNGTYTMASVIEPNVVALKKKREKRQLRITSLNPLTGACSDEGLLFC